jgi:Predicted membrane protein
MKSGRVFFFVYSTLLILLVSQLPLWLDEIIQLLGVRDLPSRKLLSYVAMNPGGVPGGYLVQYLSLKCLGYSVLSARLPSLMFSVLACYGLLRLSRRLPIRHSITPLLIFAALPLQMRYALEARPYSQALCLSVWATVAFFALIDKPGWRRAIPYSLCMAAGFYTQPFVAFVACAHALWIFFNRGKAPRHSVLWTAAGIGAALLSFLPWYLYASPSWRQTLQPEHYEISIKAPLLVLRELVGAGYVGTGLILALAAIGIRVLPGRDRLFWLLYILMPICLALAADAVFGYFLAIRQMIFVLAPLSLLAAIGLEHLYMNVGARGHFASVGLGIALLIGNLSYFRKDHENWQAAAEELAGSVQQKDCIVFVPHDSGKYFWFFQPGLGAKQCSPDLPPVGDVAVAVSPYAPNHPYRALHDKLRKDWNLSETRDFNGPRIHYYRLR